MLPRAVAFFLIALLLAATANAAIYIVPRDGELIDSADAIVIGTITQMNGEFLIDGDIATMIDVEVSAVLKGNVDPSMRIRMTELGGTVGSQVMAVSAAPNYWRRNNALIFLKRGPNGEWRTWGAALGKFDFVTDRYDRNLIVRWAVESDMSLYSPDGHPVVERLRDADGFLDFIRQRVQQQSQVAAGGRRRAVAVHPDPAPSATTNAYEEEGDYFVDDIAIEDVEPPAFWDVRSDQTGYPASAYSTGYRWNVFDAGGSVTFFASGTQPGYDHLGAAQRALGAWTNDPGSNVRYNYGGTRSLGYVNDGVNAIIFSSNQVPEGAVAYARWYGGASHTYKGESFISISEGDVIVRAGINVSQQVFDEAITHELGHTLGFRHSDQGTPYSTQAVMSSIISGVYGATLGPWDADAVHTVYASATQTTPAPGAPTGLVARATSTTAVLITWNPVANATGYQIERASMNGPFAQIGTPTGASFTDTGRTPNTTYIYRVRAVGTGGTSAYSNIDHATTVIFIDDSVTPGVPVKDEHITQLRTAINAVRAAVGFSPVVWTQPVGPGSVVRAAHITEMRNALTPALAALGITAVYTNPTLTTGSPIRAVHIQELRNYVK